MGGFEKHPRGRISEQGSGPGTAHFLLRRCKPQAEPSGNRVTTEESPAARARFGGGLEGSAYWEGIPAEGVRQGVKAKRTPPILLQNGRPQSPSRRRRPFSAPAQRRG